MKKLFLSLVLVLGFTGLFAQNNNKEESIEISVEAFQEKAGNFVGKEVYVTGTVDHVCKHGGKRVVLVGKDGKSSLKITAGEKISKFDKEIEGENLKVLGTVTESKMDEAFLDEKEKMVKEHHKPTDLEYIEDMNWIKEKRKEIKSSEKGYLSSYSLDGIKYEIIK